ncbi:MAG: ATP-dependent DNA helicase RecG [Planctomycetaceae bacterium]
MASHQTHSPTGQESDAHDGDPLETPVQFLKGVGPARSKLLAKIGLKTAEDVLFYMPRDVLDLSDVREPSELEAGIPQAVRGSVADSDVRRLSNGRTLTSVLLRCGREFVRGVWFNQPWMQNRFRMEDVVLFSGKPKRSQGRWEFSNPHTQWLDLDDEDENAEAVSVLPLYGLTDGLKMHEVRKIVRTAMENFLHSVPDRIPATWLETWKLPGIQETLRQLHQPASSVEFELAQRRLLFEDLLEFQLAVAARRRAWKAGGAAPEFRATPKIDSRIRRLFPFQFTAGQDVAIGEITADLRSGRAMHRLLQADVGAGKTAIAVYSMLVAVAAGYQSALMAPTALLATQHWQTIDRALAQSRVRRRLLTGSLTAAQRRTVLADIAAGDVDLVVGTQALIQKGVDFNSLGLVVIDEQHKFGVGQRASFSLNGQHPHVLVMTATPIPRSLCLTQFGDLDISVINELPPGRQPIRTWRVFDPATRDNAWKFVRERLHEGRQVYVVCPRVSAPVDDASPEVQREQEFGFESGQELAGSTEEVYRQLTADELSEFRIGLVHGQMDSQSKADAMEAFRSGETQALVSTTVVEVGVDVPNATVIVIQQAERFGLSQLHQLRGRIGRGRHQGYCFLFSDGTSPEVVKRLSALEKTADGFEIAEVDFEMRGPGDILGTRQHGALPLRFASLTRDRALLEEVREVAFELVASARFDEPEFVPLKIQVLERFGELMELPRSG